MREMRFHSRQMNGIDKRREEKFKRIRQTDEREYADGFDTDLRLSQSGRERAHREKQWKSAGKPECEDGENGQMKVNG